MEAQYQLWYHDPRQVIHHIFANPEFASGIDYAPHHDFQDEKRLYHDFMSGDWAWDQCDIIAVDSTTHGSMFVPIVLGTDKTTISVATGQHAFHPIYLLVGNVHNHIRVITLLLLYTWLGLWLTGTREDMKDKIFRDFRRRLFHGSLTVINNTIKPYMQRWDLIRCPDHHFCQAIYGLGPYIADYPEQSVAAGTVYGCCDANPTDLDNSVAKFCTREQMMILLETEDDDTLWFGYGMVPDFRPFTTHFPRADIYELLTPDLLHQVIKGMYKDHLITWVEEYLEITYGSSRG
ncbi:hypothetical protein BDM02DRAFT_3192497, partial [Thelephora ganbajun]